MAIQRPPLYRRQDRQAVKDQIARAIQREDRLKAEERRERASKLGILFGYVGNVPLMPIVRNTDTGASWR
jgi:hypothetical protein